MTTKQRFYFRSFASGGGSDPDPIIYCPANGYIPDPAVVHVPFPLPESTPESLIFVCDASLGNWIAATAPLQRLYVSAGIVLYQLYNTAGDLVDSFNDNSVYINYNFPTTDIYVLKISVSGGVFTGFYNSDLTPLDHLECITNAIINAPNITQLSLRGVPNCETCEFRITASALVTITRMFYGNHKMQYFNVPASFQNLNYLNSGFENTIIKSIDLSALDLSGIGLSDGTCKNCKDLMDFKFPAYFSGTRCSSFFENTIRLKNVQMFTSAPNVGNAYAGYDYFFRNSAVEGEIIIPEAQYNTSISGMFQDASNVTIVRFLGNWPALVTTASAFLNASSLHTVEMPRTVGGTAQLTSPFSTANSGMRYYIGPDVGFITFPLNAGLISITGDNDNSGHTLQANVTLYTGFRTTLTELQTPKLRCQRFLLGTTLATKFTVLNSLEIDWANSNWSNATSPQLSISAAIDATEINRILTALPTVAGKTADFRYCDGYATCDKTIATAKGWTML